MKVIALMLAMSVFGTTIAGAPAAPQRKPDPVADRINFKIRRLQIVDQLLPVLLTKEQVRKLLPVIEKCRQDEVDLEKRELQEMKEFEPELDKVLDAAIKERKTADEEFYARYKKMTSAFVLTRQILVGSSTHKVLEAMKPILNEGQLKAAEKALDPRLFGETDPDSLSSDAKLKIWIREVLLDRATYDILVDMSR